MCAKDNDTFEPIPTTSGQDDQGGSAFQDVEEPEVEEPEADAEAKVETKVLPPADDAEDSEAKAKAWDKDRQKRDEERAARQKATEDRVNAISEKLEALPDQLSEQIVKRLLGSQDRKTPAQQEQTDDVLAVLEALDENADFETIVKAIKSLPKALKGRDAAIKQLQATLEGHEQKMTARELSDADKEIADEQWKLCDALDKRFSGGKPVLRADALTRAKELIAEDGCTAANPPSPREAKAYIRLAYREVAEEAEKQRERRKNEPEVDTLVGGSKAGSAKRGSLAEVYADMKRSGQLNE